MTEVLRNERKFLLNQAEMLQLRYRLQQLLHEDPHNGYQGYIVRSLYFDTEYDGDFYDQAFGLETRKKVRLRIYHPQDDFAALEIKQKQGVQQRKRSLRLRREDARRMIDRDYTPLLAYAEPLAAECYALMKTRCYSPKTIVQYRRVAFIAKENNIRITFDHFVEATISNFDLFSQNLLMTPVLDRSQAVLEVKFNGFLLSYIKDMLRSVCRSELSVSKYGLSRQIGYHANR